MRVIMDARTVSDRFPGIGRYVVSLAGALRTVAPELSLTLLCEGQEPAGRLALPDLPRIACPASPSGLRQQWKVRSALRQSEAEVYHSPFYRMPYLPGIPTVLTVYDFIPLVCPADYTAGQRLIYRAAHALALRAARAVVTISRASAADLARFFRIDPERVMVTPLAAAPHFRPQAPAAISAASRKYRLPQDYALFLASNKPHKNLFRLIESWPEVVRRLPEARLVVAGHWDPRYERPRARAAELGLEGSVHFAGPVAEEDLPALYGGAAAFIFPSVYEGFGLPVLEAMACGTPVICSNTSSLPEVAGHAALLIDPTNTPALAAAICRLLSDADLRAGLRSRSLAQAATFSWERTALGTLAAYRAALGQAGHLTPG
jgi:alpha-1,3-rhamnosyl/mannosyltransferase